MWEKEDHRDSKPNRIRYVHEPIKIYSIHSQKSNRLLKLSVKYIYSLLLLEVNKVFKQNKTVWILLHPTLNELFKKKKIKSSRKHITLKIMALLFVCSLEF